MINYQSIVKALDSKGINYTECSRYHARKIINYATKRGTNIVLDFRGGGEGQIFMTAAKASDSVSLKKTISVKEGDVFVSKSFSPESFRGKSFSTKIQHILAQKKPSEIIRTNNVTNDITVYNISNNYKGTKIKYNDCVGRT